MFKVPLLREKNRAIGSLNKSLTMSLLILLLVQAVNLQAEPASSDLKSALLVPESEVEDLSVASSAVSSSQLNKIASKTNTGFPRWPERKKTSGEKTPPPPPGPYMSTALSGHSVRGPAFEKVTNRPKLSTDAEQTSIDTLSPDRAWPNNLQPPNRWKPESGYQFYDSRGFAAQGHGVQTERQRSSGGYRSELRMKQSRMMPLGYRAGNQPGGRPINNMVVMPGAGMQRQMPQYRRAMPDRRMPYYTEQSGSQLPYSAQARP